MVLGEALTPIMHGIDLLVEEICLFVIWTIVVANDIGRYPSKDIIYMEHCIRNMSIE